MLWWLQAGELKCEQHQSLGQMVYYLVFHYYDKISEKINLQRGKFYFGGFSVWLLGLLALGLWRHCTLQGLKNVERADLFTS
jgi:hypothetical protein